MRKRTSRRNIRIRFLIANYSILNAKLPIFMEIKLFYNLIQPNKVSNLRQKRYVHPFWPVKYESNLSTIRKFNIFVTWNKFYFAFFTR